MNLAQEMKKFFEIITPKKILLKKGNVYKYFLKHKFFTKGIKDFYFSEINRNCCKGWKIKKRNTVLMLTNGKIKVYLKKDDKLKSITLKSNDKKILIIKKNVTFKLKNLYAQKSIVISFLNEKY